MRFLSICLILLLFSSCQENDKNLKSLQLVLENNTKSYDDFNQFARSEIGFYTHWNGKRIMKLFINLSNRSDSLYYSFESYLSEEHSFKEYEIQYLNTKMELLKMVKDSYPPIENRNWDYTLEFDSTSNVYKSIMLLEIRDIHSFWLHYLAFSSRTSDCRWSTMEYIPNEKIDGHHVELDYFPIAHSKYAFASIDSVTQNGVKIDYKPVYKRKYVFGEFIFENIEKGEYSLYGSIDYYRDKRESHLGSSYPIEYHFKKKN